jgi:hypothetical protein
MVSDDCRAYHNFEEIGGGVYEPETGEKWFNASE